MNGNDSHFNNPRRANDELYQDIAGMPAFNGIEQEQKISDMRARNHGESKTEQTDRDRRVYTNHPAPDTFGATTVGLANLSRERDFNYDGYVGGTFGQTHGESYTDRLKRHQAEKSLASRVKSLATNFKSFDKAKKFWGRNPKNIVVAGCLAGLVVAGGSYVAFVNNANAQGFEEATAIEQTVDLPREIFGKYDLEIQHNGEAFFVDPDGNRVKGYNGIDADTVASKYKDAEDVNEEIIPTEAEYEAGLTQEQLQEKRALDAQMAEQGQQVSQGRSK